jgi:PTH1 family peptidyl-tRNA hydrolase
MHIIAGLGNPEPQYKGTRHNAGFEVVNKLTFDTDIVITKKRFRSLTGEGFIAGEKILFAKPQTYMNLSGEAIRAILDFYKLGTDSLVVIYDDIDLPTGDIRVRSKGSAGGHNGMKNIISQLGTDEFPRVRVGTGPKPPEIALIDFVLGGFRKDEQQAYIDGVTKAGDAVLAILRDGVPAAMNKYNHRLQS